MRYVTTFERRGIAKGIEKGIEKGLEEGAASHKASLSTILQLRFGRIPAGINSAIENINELETLKNLVINAALTESLEGFQKYLDSIDQPANKVSEPAADYTPTAEPPLPSFFRRPESRFSKFLPQSHIRCSLPARLACRSHTPFPLNMMLSG